MLGDLNEDILNNNSRFIKRLTDELSLQIVNHGATHRSNGSLVPKTWIDVICIDCNDTILSYNNKHVPCKRHNLIDVKIELFLPKPPQVDFTFRQFNKITPEAISGFLISYVWSPFDIPTFNIDSALDSINNNLQLAVDELAPLKTFKPRKTKDPWINPELQLLIQKSKASERLYIRSKDAILLTGLITLSEDIAVLTENARSSFLHEKLNDALNNKQYNWREMRHLGLIPTPRSDLHGFTPEELNAHFAGVSRSDVEDLDGIANLITSSSEDGFRFTTIILNDVILAVKHFNSQATGVDGIPQKVIAKSLLLGPT